MTFFKIKMGHQPRALKNSILEMISPKTPLNTTKTQILRGQVEGNQEIQQYHYQLFHQKKYQLSQCKFNNILIEYKEIINKE